MKRKLLSVFAIAATVIAAQFTLPATTATALANPPAYNQSEVQTIRSNVEAATTIAGARDAAQVLLDHYGVALSTDCAPDYTSFGCESLVESDLPYLKESLTLFVKEWSKYPVQLVDQSNLQTVRWVKSVGVEIGNPSYDPDDPDSEPTMMQLRAAIPDSSRNEMIYSVQYGPLSYVSDQEYMDNVIHHEFYHLYDEATNGGYRESWPEWEALNPAGFEYGDGGASCYGTSGVCPLGDHTVEGFVSGYATSSILEDTAETFAFLMETATYNDVQGWIQADTALANKIALFRSYLEGQVPAMNAAYFTNIHGLNPAPVEEGAGTGEATPGAPNTGVERAPGIVALTFITAAFIASVVALIALLVKKRAFAFIRK